MSEIDCGFHNDGFIPLLTFINPLLSHYWAIRSSCDIGVFQENLMLDHHQMIPAGESEKVGGS